MSMSFLLKHLMPNVQTVQFTLTVSEKCRNTLNEKKHKKKKKIKIQLPYLIK